MAASARALTEGDAGSGESARAPAGRHNWPYWAAVWVLVVGLVVTGVLTWVSYGLYTRNETRQLHLRAREVGTALTAALPNVQTPLASATALANASGGNAAKFKQVIAPYVGFPSGAPLVSASLWRVARTARGPIAVVGVPPALAADPGQAATFFRRASRSSKLTVIGLLGLTHPRLGYAFTGMAGDRFAAYGESALPLGRYVPVQRNSTFNDLNFALFLGDTTNPADLLAASVRHLPLSGRQTTVRVPFGDTSFTVTVAARRALGGSLPKILPWVIAIVGTLLSLIAAVLALRLIDRRRRAEGLARRLEEVADENRRLYAQQRDIAQTLQRALLPEHLPQLAGIEVSGRYEAGVEGVDVGGDWYDVIALGEHRLLLVVGDVSGRGLRAATTMASLRFAIHAYAAQGDAPATILSKLSRLVSVGSDGQLATVLFALVDVEAHEINLTNAGHLPPLVISPQGREFVETPVGLPVGIEREATYSSTTLRVPPQATFLAFTDGLVERRGESIDDGLERLRSRVSANDAPLDHMLAQVLNELRQDPSDDTAIAGVRWVS